MNINLTNTYTYACMYACMLYASCGYKSFLTSLMANCGSDNNNSVTIIPIITVSKKLDACG